jgi:hypothetical protein
MNTRFGLLGVVAVVMMTCGFADTAKAQIVKIKDVQYTIAFGNNPAKAEPKGDWSLPGGKLYRVCCDYGTINGGNYTLTPLVSGEVHSAPILTKGNGGNYKWVVVNASQLASVPENLNVRARIQMYNADTDAWVFIGNTDYAAIP